MTNELPTRREAHPLPAHLKPSAPNLLDALSRDRTLAAKLREVAKSTDDVAFEQVAEGAHSALCAVIARAAQENGSRIWLVCPALRAQEQLHNELQQWLPDALFFPELEVAPVEGSLPDPETMAERLAIIHRLNADDGKKSPLVMVLTRAALEEAVPDEGLTGPGQSIFMQSLEIDPFFKIDLRNPRRLQRPVPLVHRLQVVGVHGKELRLGRTGGGFLGHRAERIAKEAGSRDRFAPFDARCRRRWTACKTSFNIRKC